AVDRRLASEAFLRLRRAFRRAALVRLTLISMTRWAPRPRTRTVALGLKAVSPFDPVVSPSVVVVDDEAVSVPVELVVAPPCTVVVFAPGSAGSGGRATGRPAAGKAAR